MQIVTHAMAGWLISQPLESRRDRQLVTIAAVIADLDGLVLLGGVDLYQKYHHTFGHNVFAWIVTIFVCAAFSNSKIKMLLLSAIAFGSHLLFDLLGSGYEWPLVLWWPVSGVEYGFQPPFQWELASWQNYLTGLLFLVVVLAIGLSKGRTIVEVFSSIADRKVVMVIRKWAGMRRDTRAR